MSCLRLHLGAQLKYQILYESESVKTIRSNAPIRKRTIFETFSKDFQVVFDCLHIVLDRFRAICASFWRRRRRRRRRRRDAVVSVVVD